MYHKVTIRVFKCAAKRLNVSFLALLGALLACVLAWRAGQGLGLGQEGGGGEESLGLNWVSGSGGQGRGAGEGQGRIGR